MKLNNEQRERLANELSLPWGRVDLTCDGYRVTLSVQRWKAMTYRVVTYVNGELKYAWLSGSSEAPESKFLRASIRPNVTPARRRELEKAIGKRRVKSDPYLSGTFVVYLPDWSSGKAALSHLCKVCDSISEIPRSAETDVVDDADTRGTA